MRIIAGTFGGRSLHTLKGQHTRPTSDRIKEALFSSLGSKVIDAAVLDAFSGSGALALECCSRGAAFAWLIEQNRAAQAVCEKNITTLAVPNCKLLRGDCLKLLPQLRAAGESCKFDLIFADPPYHKGLLEPFTRIVAEGEWLAAEGVLVAETSTKQSDFVLDARFEVYKTSAYGDTTLHYCRWKS